jgi:hypothetical protein
MGFLQWGRALDDRAADSRLAAKTERAARTWGYVWLGVGAVFMVVDVLTEGSAAPAVGAAAFSGGLLLGRATEVAERRRGKGLREGG